MNNVDRRSHSRRGTVLSALTGLSVGQADVVVYCDVRVKKGFTAFYHIIDRAV